MFILAVIGLMLATDLYTLYVLLFITGATFGGRIIVALNYLLEFLADKDKELMVFVRLMSSAFIVIGFTAFFQFGTKHWLTVISVFVVLAIAGTLYQVIFVPETPQWLHSMERYEESRNVLKYIAGYNMKKDYGDFSFVNEVSDEKK